MTPQCNNLFLIKQCLLLWCLLCLLLMNACGEGEKPEQGPPTKFPFQMKATVVDADTEEGFARIPVKLDERIVGYTDKDGVFKGTIMEAPGTTVKLSLGTVPGIGYTSLAAIETVMEVGKGIDGQPSPRPLTLAVKAHSTTVDYFVWVALKCIKPLNPEDCQNIPIKKDDEIIATTDIHGRANFSGHSPKNTEFQVDIEAPTTLADGSATHFAPKKSSFHIKVGRTAQAFVLQEQFTQHTQHVLPKAKKKSKKVKKTRTRTRTRNNLWPTLKKSKKKKKKKKLRKKTKTRSRPTTIELF